MIHDVACEKKELTSKDTHRMFYEAMLEDGTNPDRALLFYMAVRVFGPKWPTNNKANFNQPLSVATPSFEEIERALDVALNES